jgi:transitional endoplasmic reticulum ATPase
VTQNGILLHGPRGTGKTFLAEATAGEFGMNFLSIPAPSLLQRWIGTTGDNIEGVFARAMEHRPIVLFFDEIDALGGRRQVAADGGDPGGAGREFNAIVTQLMRSIDQYRSQAGLVIMAATNFLDGLEPALVREGRFDVKIRIDLPDDAARGDILRAQLRRRPSMNFSIDRFAKKIVGASAARIKALVDRAAANAAEQGRMIEADDLDRALAATGGTDRPLVQAVDWEDVVVSGDVEGELRTLVRILNCPGTTGIEPPTGILLIGPPGTGKTMIARLLATQTHRSFYPLTAADILGSAVGASVKRLAEIFARAKENGPSIVFLDEVDGLVPRNRGHLSVHDTQLVEQMLIEIGQLVPANNVFLIATTNHSEQIDPRLLRGGRFSEKIYIGLPDRQCCRRLLNRFLQRSQLAESLSVNELTDRLTGNSPADLEAICRAAKRLALRRMPDDANTVPPLEWNDFAQAVQRVQVGAAS